MHISGSFLLFLLFPAALCSANIVIFTKQADVTAIFDLEHPCEALHFVRQYISYLCDVRMFLFVTHLPTTSSISFILCMISLLYEYTYTPLFHKCSLAPDVYKRQRLNCSRYHISTFIFTFVHPLFTPKFTPFSPSFHSVFVIFYCFCTE